MGGGVGDKPSTHEPVLLFSLWRPLFPARIPKHGSLPAATNSTFAVQVLLASAVRVCWFTCSPEEYISECPRLPFASLYLLMLYASRFLVPLRKSLTVIYMQEHTSYLLRWKLKGLFVREKEGGRQEYST